MYCKNCGSMIQEGSKFCSNCGTPISIQDNSAREQTRVETQQREFPEYYNRDNTPYDTGDKHAKPKKKKGKGCLLAFAIVVASLIFFGVVFSFFSSEPEETESTNNITKQTVNTTKQVTTTKQITIEKKLIYDKNNVKIYVTGFEDNKVKFYIENNSNLNLSFNAHSYAINGIMTGNNIYDMNCDVAANAKANTSLTIKSDFLSKYSIDEIQSIEINFWAYDNDKSFKEFDTGKITINTNASSSSLTKIKGTEELYNEKSIEVQYINQDNNNYTYLITNNTDSLFTFDIYNITINGFTSSETDYDLYNEEVLNGCQYVFTITVSNSFMYENNIDKVEDISFNISIRPNADYFNEWTTPMLSTQIK